MKIARKVCLVLAGVIASSIFAWILVTPALADDSPAVYDEAWLTKRALAADLYKCYGGGHMESTINIATEFYSIESLAKDDTDQIAALPTTVESNNLTCKQVLARAKSYSTIAIPSEAASPSQIAPFMTEIGYVPSGDTTSGQMCYRFVFTGSKYLVGAGQPEGGTFDGSFEYRTPKFCVNVDANGNIEEDGLFLEGGSEGIDTAGGVDPFLYAQDGYGIIAMVPNTEQGASGESNQYLGENCKKGQSAADCINSLSVPTYATLRGTDQNGQDVRITYQINDNDGRFISESTSQAGVSYNYSVDPNSTPRTAVEKLFGSTANVFTSAPKVSLYQIYLNSNTSDMVCEVPDGQKDEYIGNGYSDKITHLIIDGTYHANCYIKITDESKEFNGVDGDSWYTKVKTSDILDYLTSTTVRSSMTSKVVSANARIYGGSSGDNNNSGNGVITPYEDSAEVDCFNSAGALGWILCPVIDFAQHTITAIYDSIVSNFLEFRAEFLDINGSGKSVYTAWQVFQSFANIIFVIVLLVVIFSQLTGIGIDNLGIKRVLPKLIVAAVLINLSYIICMLFVDISNIVGSGINTLFANISVTATSSGSTGAAVLSTIMTGAVAGAVGGLAVATAGIWGGVVVIPLVLGLITTLIGILFFFILLGARQAAIVILVVVSPVAFACYMLPNTKAIFDKWLKIFEALLILYPICGLLMGGSAFASDILMTLDTGFLGKLIAMLVGVVPFFFIPTLLRSAFSAMGNLGARITGFGQNMGRRLTGAIGNSDAVRDANTRLRAGINRDGSLNAFGRYRQDGAFTNWAARSRIPGVRQLGSIAQQSNRRANARAQAARIKYMDEQAREERLNSPEFFQQYQRSQEMALEKEQLNTEMDIINDSTQKGEIWETNPADAGDPKRQGIYSLYREAVESGNAYRARAIAEIAGRRKDTANQFIQQFKTDSEAGLYDNHQDILQAVAKQMSSGENSKNYRASNAMGFEYASQLVRGDTRDNYGVWKSNTNNVKAAMEHHVTNGRELYGQSNSSLRELAALAGTDDNKQYLADLARRGEFEGLNSGGEYDQTKEASVKAIKGLAAPKANSSDARPGETFDVGNNAPSRGKMNDEELQNLRNFYQRKIDNNTATPEDRNALNRINNELDLRETGYGGDTGTPV